MSKGSEVVLLYTDELQLQLQTMEVGQEAVLLDEPKLGGSIVSIASKATVEDQDPFHRLAISSELGTSFSKTDSGLIIAGLQEVLAEQDAPYRVERPFKKIGHGTLFLIDNTYDESLATIVSPVLNGQKWSVSSLLQDFRYDQITGGSEAVGLLLAQHLCVVRALINTMSDTYGSENSGFRKLFMTFPIDMETDQERSYTPSEFNSFVGIDDIIQELEEAVDLANTPPSELARFGIEPTQAIILHGPSGVGKTELMHTFGRAIGADIRETSLSDIQDMHVGEWASRLDSLFESAYEEDERVLLVFDEADGLFATGNPNSTSNITAVLKRQLEKMKNYPNVFVAMATNHIDDIDPDIRAAKRIPLQIPIPQPKPSQRAAIFEKLLVGDRLKDLSFDDVTTAFSSIDKSSEDFDFAQLSALTEDFSPGDLKAIVDRVKRTNFLAARKVEVAPENPTQEQVVAAVHWFKTHRT